MRRSRTARTGPAGSRVFIRRPRPSDERAFLSLVRKSRALHRSWVSPPSSRKAFAAWLARGRRKTHVPLLVCLRAGGAIAAVANLSEIVRGSYEGAYLGYYSMAPYSGKGYLSEGLALVLDFAFGKHRLHRLEANIQPANTRSKALVRRLGFVCEGYSERYLKVTGRFRDHERWAIRKEIWPRPPAPPAPPGSWSGMDVTDTVAKSNEKRWVTPLLPARDYEFALSGTGGDADLYLRVGHPPTTTAYDCRPYKSGSNETCEVRLAAPAVVHVMVRGYAAASSAFRLVGKQVS